MKTEASLEPYCRGETEASWGPYCRGETEASWSPIVEVKPKLPEPETELAGTLL